MRTLILGLLLGTTALLAADTVGVRNVSGSVLVNRPVTFPRYFLRGEIAHCAQAVSADSGIALSTQCDVKTRWPDGSLQFGIITYVIPSLANAAVHTVSFRDQACTTAGYLTKAQILDSGAVWAANLGAKILNVNGDVDQSFDLRAMLTDWDGVDGGATGLDVRYWLKGPLVSQLIVENRSTRAYDKGWKTDHTADTTNKSLHPIFVVTIWNNWSVVKVQAILENMWTDTLQAQTFDLGVQVGNPLGSTQWDHPAFTQYALTRIQRTFWVGSSLGNYGLPDDIKIDLNLPYMISTGILPPYDTSITVPRSAVQTYDLNVWNGYPAAQRDINGSAGQAGSFYKYMPAGGQTIKDWIGIFPAWAARYFYTMGDSTTLPSDTFPRLWGEADMSGVAPVHVREGRNDTTKFCGYSCTGSDANVTAYGWPVSIDARPTLRLTQTAGFRLDSGSNQADRVTPLENLSSNGWTVDDAHQPSHAFTAYLLTGDWFWLEEMQHWSTWNIFFPPRGTGLNSRGAIGWEALATGQTRSIAWILRTMGQLAQVIPDAQSHLKAYWTSKMQNNIAALEGGFNLTDGSYYNTSIWNWANNTPCGSTVHIGCRRYSQTNPLYIPVPIQSWISGRQQLDVAGQFNGTGDGGAVATITSVTNNGAGKVRLNHAPATGSYAHEPQSSSRESYKHLFLVYVTDGSGNPVEGPYLQTGTDETSYVDIDVPYNPPYTLTSLSKVCYRGAGLNQFADAWYSSATEGPLVTMFYWAVFGYLEQMGWREFGPINRRIARLPIHLYSPAVVETSFDFRLISSEYPMVGYSSGVNGGNSWTVGRLHKVGGTWYTDAVDTWDQIYAGIGNPALLRSNYPLGCANDASSYCHVLKGTLAFLYSYDDNEGFSGAQAWSVARAAVLSENLLSTNPKWAFSPRILEGPPPALVRTSTWLQNRGQAIGSTSLR